MRNCIHLCCNRRKKKKQVAASEKMLGIVMHKIYNGFMLSQVDFCKRNSLSFEKEGNAHNQCDSIRAIRSIYIEFQKKKKIFTEKL